MTGRHQSRRSASFCDSKAEPGKSVAEHPSVSKTLRSPSAKNSRIDMMELLPLAEEYLQTACGAILGAEYFDRTISVERSLNRMLSDMKKRLVGKSATEGGVDAEDLMVLQHALDQYLNGLQIAMTLKLAEVFESLGSNVRPLPLPASVKTGGEEEDELDRVQKVRGKTEGPRRAIVLRGYLCPEGDEGVGFRKDASGQKHLFLSLLFFVQDAKGELKERKIRLKVMNRGIGEWLIRQPVGLAVEVTGQITTTGKRTDFLVERIAPWSAGKVPNRPVGPVCISSPLLMTALLTGYDHSRAAEWAAQIGQDLTRLTAASCQGLEEGLKQVSGDLENKVVREQVLEQGRAAVREDMKKTVRIRLKYRDPTIPLVRVS